MSRTAPPSPTLRAPAAAPAVPFGRGRTRPGVLWPFPPASASDPALFHARHRMARGSAAGVPARATGAVRGGRAKRGCA